MVLIEDVVLPMVVIENVLMLLLMIERQERKPTTAMVMVITKQQSHTVLGVAVERGPAIATIADTIGVSASNMSSMLDARNNTMNN